MLNNAWIGKAGALLGFVALIGGGAWLLDSRAESSAQPGYRIESALPQGAVMHLRLDGKACVDEVGSLAIMGLMNEEQMKEFVAPLRKAINETSQEMLSEMEEAIGLKMEELRTLGSGSMTLTLNDFDMGDGSGPPMVDLILTFDLRDNPDLLKKVAGLIAKGLKEQMGAKPVQDTLDGVSVWRTEMEGIDVMWATLGDYLVAGTKAETMRQVFAKVKAKTEVRGLFASDDFTKCWNETLPRGKGVLFAYIDMARVLSIMKKTPLADEVPIDGVAQAIGADSWRGMAYGASYEGGAVVERFFLHAPKGLTGLYGNIQGSDKILTSLSLAPRETFAYSGFRMNLSEMAEGVVNSINEIDEDAAAEVDEALGEFEGECGFSLLDDFLPCLDQEYAFWMADSPFGGMIPEMIFAFEVKEGKKAKFLEYAKKLIATATDQDISRSFKFKGRELHYFDTGRIMGGGGFNVGLKPTVMYEGNMLLIAMAPQTLKNFVASRANQRAPFASKADLKNGMGALGCGQAGVGNAGIGYLDLGRIATMLIDTAAPIAQSVRLPDEVPLDMTTFPTSDIFQRHLFGVTTVSTIRKDGVSSAIHSPMGYIPLFMAGGAASGLVFMGVSRGMAGAGGPPVELIEIDEEVIEEGEKAEEAEDGN